MGRCVRNIEEPTMSKVYLAGPGVLRLDAARHGRDLVALAAQMGFEGLYPLDGELGNISGLSGPELANRIRLANEGLIRAADGLIADMTPFRGVSMDPGTACEIGFAYALGKPVVGYVSAERNMRDYRSRMSLSLPDGDILERGVNDAGHEVFIAPDGMSVEDFGLNDNLMMSAGLSGLCVGPAQALTRLKEILEDRSQPSGA